MKRLLMIFTIFTGLLLVLNCSSTKKNISSSNSKKANTLSAEDTIGEAWSLYSYGWYYKQQALKKKKQAQEKTKILSKAIKYFERSLSSGKALDRIYLQISDCYYYKYDYSKSLVFARKAIKANKYNTSSHSRIYNIYMRLKKYSKAAGILEEYIEAKPNSIHIQYILGEHYYSKLRDMKKARSSFKNVIRISNTSSSEDYYRENACYYIAYIAYKQNDLDSAIPYFHRVLKINQRNVKAAYMLAIIYMKKLELEKAEKYSKLYLQKYPGNHVMNAFCGRIKYIKGDTSSIHYLRKAMSGRSIQGLLARGLHSEMTGNYSMSKKLMKTVMKYRPKFLTPHIVMAKLNLKEKNKNDAFSEFITLGIITYRKKKYNLARNYFTSTLAIKNNIAEIYFFLGQTYERTNRINMAIINFNKGNKIKPSINTMLQIGYLYGQKKDYTKALEYFYKALKKEPKSSKPHFFIGLGSIWKKDYKNAEGHIRKALEIEKKNEQYYFYLAVVLEKQKRLDAAIETLELAITHYPNSARVCNYLGYLYADNGMKIERSQMLINRALKKEPENGAYLDSLGWVYYKKGNFQLALEKLLEAEKKLTGMKRKDPVVFDHIGDAYKKNGDLKKALIYWKRSIKIEKNVKIEEKIKKYSK